MGKQSVTVQHVLWHRMNHIHSNLGNSYRNGPEHNKVLTDSMNSMVWDFTELYYGTSSIFMLSLKSNDKSVCPLYQKHYTKNPSVRCPVRYISPK
jgi:hypothetical protein